jgi:hypothetical protein
LQKSSYFGWWLGFTICVFLSTIPLFSQPTLQKASLPEITFAPQDLANGNIHIVAVMVEFQPDDNRFTTGNGTFNPDFLNKPNITIDPLPHDRGYFEAHLEFTKNYFERVSGAKMTVSYEIIPQIVTVPNEMAHYSPLGEDGEENEKLALLAQDTWTIVAQKGLLPENAIDPDRTMFILFHAGAGRDLELVGTTLNKTPQDIPSVYLSRESFQRLLNEPTFDGFSLNNTLSAWNTAILPETQSRPGEDILGNEFVLELSINGLLTAMIGSFVGLPDLFNTETGRSGIGRFGLMDGAGFFSYYGLFPPEPSAWEKIFLGWITPFDISSALDNNTEITLPAAILRDPNSIAFYPISSDEYYLIENRHRDIDNTGVTLTIRTPDGAIESRTITNAEDRFNPFDLSKIDEILPPGVLIDVSNFDWSLPGGLDVGEDRTSGTADDRELNGGILIWHIDEQVIRAKMDNNAINNNPLRRGVRLIEADAAQDIGRPAGGVTAYEQGGPFDFWWFGNDFTVINATGQRTVLYQNRLADDTRPNNRSNTGSRTYFEFYDFSDNLPTASFKAKRNFETDIRPIRFSTTSFGQNMHQNENYTRGFPLSLVIHVIDGDTILIAPNGSETIAYNINEDLLQGLGPITPHQPLLIGETITIAQNSNVDGSVSGDIIQYTFDTNSRQYTQNWLTENIPAVGLLAEGKMSPSNYIDVELTQWTLNKTSGEVENLFSQPNQTARAGNRTIGWLRSVVNTVLLSNDKTFQFLPEEAAGNRLYLSAAVGGAKTPEVVLLFTDQRIVTIDALNGSIISEIFTDNTSWPILADITGDRAPEIIYVNYENNTIEARNLFGAMSENFPIVAPEGLHFEGVPLVVHSSENNPILLIAPANDSFSSVLLVYEDYLRTPTERLLVGPTRDGGSIINPILHDGKIYAVSASGDIRGWELSHRTDQPSAYIYGDPTKNNVSFDGKSTATSPISGSLLVSNETYNWPNPANDHTFVRFQTTGEAEVTTTIIGYSGQKLHEERTTTLGGQSQEIRLDTSNWGNGVYFCRITARSNGKTEHKVITMVVIR